MVSKQFGTGFENAERARPVEAFRWDVLLRA